MRGGVSVLELEKIDGMFCFAPLPASAMFVSSDLRSLHERTITVSCFGASSGFDLKQHCMDGHRHFSSFYPWCVQARLRKKRALRVSHGNRSLKSGYGVGCDFTGPFDPDVDGLTLALVVVEVRSSKGFIGLQTSRSASDTLVSLKQCESELIQAAAGTSAHGDRIAEFRHDGDTGFRGVVSEYATERGWRDTHTRGYNPNANSLAERRIGMLHQMFRTVLLYATGGHMYYEQLWGRGLVYCSWVLDHCEWTDRVSPMSYLAGAAVSLPDEQHVFGAYVLYRVDSEQRTGKWQPAAEMGIWVGLSPDVRHGHVIVPIRWNAAEQH
jgi:hypothetical protein